MPKRLASRGGIHTHTTSVSLPQQSLRVGDRITLLPNFYVENSRANGAVYQLSGMEQFHFRRQGMDSDLDNTGDNADERVELEFPTHSTQL